MRSDDIPRIVVFAGPNGSGKSTLEAIAKLIKGTALPQRFLREF
jgi:predicted ATPase